MILRKWQKKAKWYVFYNLFFVVYGSSIIMLIIILPVFYDSVLLIELYIEYIHKFTLYFSHIDILVLCIFSFARACYMQIYDLDIKTLNKFVKFILQHL